MCVGWRGLGMCGVGEKVYKQMALGNESEDTVTLDIR